MGIKRMAQNFAGFFREVFWSKPGGVFAALYLLFQFWDTFASWLPPEWGIRKMNLPAFVYVLILLVFLLVYVLYRTWQLAAHRFELHLQVKIASKPPAKTSVGRYIVLHVTNRSPRQLRDVLVTVDDQYLISGRKPRNLPLHVIRKDPFEWSSWEEPNRLTKPRGKMAFAVGQERVADIIRLGPGKNVAKATLQTRHDVLGAKGSYRIGLRVMGVYDNGGDFEIPLALEFDYLGGKNLRSIDISAKTKERRVTLDPPELTPGEKK